MLSKKIINISNSKYLVLFIGILVFLTSIFTYFSIFNQDLNFGPDPSQITGIVLLDVVLLFIFTILISKKIFKLWLERKHNISGSRLQKKIILMFTLVSLAPVMIITIFTVMFFKQGISTWFDTRISAAVDESVAVAMAYYEEHKKNIKADTLAIARDLNKDSYILTNNRTLLQHALSEQVLNKGLAEAIIYQPSTRSIISNSRFSFSFALDVSPNRLIEGIDNDEVNVITSESDDKLKAVIKLDNFFDSYLIISSYVDRKVINHMEKAVGSANEYKRLQNNIDKTQLRFLAIFIIFTSILILISTWLGMFFAVSIIQPISKLVDATKQVESGITNITVEEGPVDDEIGILARSFNSMVLRLSKQRQQLINTNIILDERKRFIEAILESVSAGIIALDVNKNITLINKSAKDILVLSDETIINVSNIIPNIENLLNIASSKANDFSTIEEINIKIKGRTKTLLTKIIAEHKDQDIEGYVISFDDITELLSAQRSAAWSDVARRIAHEIKNPLTPIHLAIDRLSKKYIDQVDDKENFHKYLDTIIRHVKNISAIVEEFVNFARMPTPILKKNDIKSIIKNCIFTQECGGFDIKYELEIESDKTLVYCDIDQLIQVFTNILKNAEESIKESDEKIDEKKITISITDSENLCIITIKDTGKGFPVNLLDRITEPYITTRKKGTGLGLAIVKKIIEDHNGNVSVGNWSEGAFVKITLPYYNNELMEA